jgi:hypothetical protein
LFLVIIDVAKINISPQTTKDLRGNLSILGLFYFIHDGDSFTLKHLVPAAFWRGDPFDK